jgi:trans-aconitate 2-methyltransferase
MPSWNPAQYLAFGDLRTRPARDLAMQVEVTDPARVADLGCGPGNSTAVCHQRWPNAALLGIDSSPAMIDAARRTSLEAEWRVADIAEWALGGPLAGRYDVLFSNAALHWVPRHAELFPQLLARLNPGGALAVQMPDADAVPHRVLRELAATEPWKERFAAKAARGWRSHPPEFYYSLLVPRAARLNIWATEYLQIMPDVNAIVEWYKGTGLRPFLDALPDAVEQAGFLRDYAARLAPFYPPLESGVVAFPFKRVFVVAHV